MLYLARSKVTTYKLESMPPTKASKLMRGKKEMGKATATDEAGNNVEPQLNMIVVIYQQSAYLVPDF